jgi:hypothetical protein
LCLTSLGERNLVKLTLLGTESENGGSPTLYATDRGTYVVQGWRVSDPEAQAQLVVPGHETVVEVPAALLRFARPAEPS